MLDETIRAAARRFGDRAAFVDARGTALSYAGLDRRSDAAARDLRDAGVAEGTVVALALPSGLDYVIAYGAAAKLGAIAAGLNPSLTDVEQAAALDRLTADVVVRRPLAEPPGDGPQPLPPDPERAVAVVFTSGTTGPPKGALFRNRQLSAICEIDLGTNWAQRWDGGGHMLASTQFAHVGFMTKLPWYLRLGTTIHVLDRWRADDVLRVVARHRIATLGVVAPQLALILRSPLLDELDVSCVTSIVAGAAASPPGLVRAARERFGAAYSIRYSSTESGGVGLATAFDADDHEALHTVGRPRPGVEVRIVADDGDALRAGDTGDTGDTGELCLRSPAMFDGYWRDPDATAAAVVDGWLHTGDLAALDADGLVTLRGRRKEMYIRGGYNVAPAEVEQVLSEHPAIAAVAVAPRPDEVMGEIGVAVVVPASGAAAPTLGGLRTFAADRLARWKLPEAIVVTDELPLTPMQKLDRPALARFVAGTPPTDPDADASLGSGPEPAARGERGTG